MNMKLAPLSLLCWAGAALAQSSLTLSGTVDVAVQHARGADQSRTGLASGGNATSKLALRGSEDLGDALSAFFWLESGFAAHTGVFATPNMKNQPHLSPSPGGGMAFDRRAIVGVRSNLGTVQMGRDWSPTYETYTGKFDPFSVSIGIGLNYAGSRNSDGVRVANSVAYTTPKLAGAWEVRLQKWLGEGAEDRHGDGQGVRIHYDQGAWSAAVAFASTELAGGSALYRNLAVAYAVTGDAALSFSVNKDQRGAEKMEGWLLGYRQRLGAGEVKASYSTIRADTSGHPKGAKLALGYVHHLSKRSAVYGTAAHIKNSRGGSFQMAGLTGVPNRSVSAMEIGVRHNF